jgi:DNA-directed RNA polymerase alpha subunit
MKTITIECNGNESNIIISDGLTAFEVLGRLRYHENNIYRGLLNCNVQINETKQPEQQVYVKDMDLSVRTKNCLLDNKIYTLKDIEQLSDRDLLKIRNFGNKCLSELQYVLKNTNQ